MLSPSRFSNLRFSLLNTTSLVIEFLLKNNRATISEVLDYLLIFHSSYTRDDVTKCVTLLFALGKVNYSEKTDKVWLIKYKTNKDEKVA
ncbi:hypothetical protein HNR48_001424 [Pseudoteredinibacter isoporae]|uniref:Uncharacterized protein n=1 Tax=Pseudoteredinibacter isoporae TaxID=570281 RepID=A0A7X0MUY3_9GAMM|nr:hypothetical protein [Pseudoteredinibacter isoporae]